jgi:hypothetical protein
LYRHSFKAGTPPKINESFEKNAELSTALHIQYGVNCLKKE